MAEKPTVHMLPLVIVLRYLAPVNTCKPWICQIMLAQVKTSPYLYHSIVEQKHSRSCIPHPPPAIEEHLTKVAYVSNLWMADTELPMKFSECRPRIYSVTYQTIKEVYKTEAATTTVTIRPGTRPRIEYEYGNDMIARQMYSAKRSAAVYGNSSSDCFLGVIKNRKSAQKAQDVYHCAILRISPRGLVIYLLPGTRPVFDRIG